MRLKQLMNNGGKTSDWNRKSMVYKVAFVRQYLSDKGYSKPQVSAIIGNLLQENDTLDPTRKNSIGATGIAQWLSEDRKSGLMAKKNPYDIRTQLDYLHEEIQGRSGAWTNNVGGKNAFFNTDDVNKLTYIFRKDFERPGESEAMDSKRMGYANAIYNEDYGKFKNMASISPVSTQYSQYDPSSQYSPEDFNEYYKLVEDMSKGLETDWNKINQLQSKSPALAKMMFDRVNTQKDLEEKTRLEAEKQQQEQISKQIEYENKQLEIALTERQQQRQQVLDMIPQSTAISYAKNS